MILQLLNETKPPRVTNAPGPQRLGNDRDVSAKDATIPPRNTNGEQRNFQVLDM